MAMAAHLVDLSDYWFDELEGRLYFMKIILTDKDANYTDRLEIEIDSEEDTMIFNLDGKTIHVDRDEAVRALIALGERSIYD